MSGHVSAEPFPGDLGDYPYWRSDGEKFTVVIARKLYKTTSPGYFLSVIPPMSSNYNGAGIRFYNIIP